MNYYNVHNILKIESEFELNHHNNIYPSFDCFKVKKVRKPDVTLVVDKVKPRGIEIARGIVYNNDEVISMVHQLD